MGVTDGGLRTWQYAQLLCMFMTHDHHGDKPIASLLLACEEKATVGDG